jgi:AsmA protein
MNKYLKYGLLTIGSLGVLLAGGVAYVAATFNPNDYKSQIIQLVKEKKQRTLKLDGDIKLTFFPAVGADLGKLSLSEFNNDKEFVAIEGAHVSLALLPLLSRQIVVDEVAVSGLKATLVKFKNGKTNIDDLLGKDEAKEASKGEAKAASTPEKSSSAQAVKFDIASVRVEKTELTYRDENSGAQYALKDINLKTGRISSSVPVKLDFAAHIQSNQPQLDIATQLKTTLTFDLDKQFYKVEGLDLQTKGVVLDISNLVLQASGDASANLATQEYTVKKWVVSAIGVKGKDNFDAKLDAPALNLIKDKFSGEKLTVNAKLDGASGKIVASLILPGLEGNAQFFKSNAITLELDIKQPEQAFNVALSSPLAGNFEVQQFNLTDLKIALKASGDKLPNKSVSSELKGSVQLDASRQSVQASLAGGLLQSQVKARVAVNNFTNPAIRFDVEVDQLDSDMYLPKKTQTVASSKAESKPDVGVEGKAGSVTGEQPLDLAALKKLNLEGSLRIGTLKVANIKSSQVRLDVKAHNGALNLNPLSANLYQGSLSGSITVNAAQAVPVFVVSEKLSGINIGPLLKDAANFDMLDGKGNVSIDLHTQGNLVGNLKKALNGNVSLSLADGAIKGINIAKKLRDAGNLFNKQPQTQSVNNDEKTDFSEMKASFKVTDGVAHNDDLSLKSPLLRLSGNGDINLGSDSINYLAKATLATTLQGQGGKDNVGGITVPVRLSGPFTDLKYTLDFGSMVSDAVKQKVKTEVKTKVQDKLKEGLKGLFR